MPALSKENIAELVRRSDQRGLARALTIAENGGAQAAALLHSLFDPGRGGRTVGVTGPPGAGKSTLVDRLLLHWRKAGRRIGVVAVDPSSPFSGGALLGDRLRMQDHACDPGVFIRSMGSRGHVGGLADATAQVAEVLAAAGFDPVVLETVGVGQGEVEVAGLADVTVLVLVPGLGDDVQAMKAGIMEIGDLIVLNKADRPGMDQLESAVSSVLDLLPAGAPRPAVIRCAAVTGEGVDEVAHAIDVLLDRPGASEEVRRERVRAAIARVVDGRGTAIGRMMLERLYGWDRAVDLVMSGRTSPYMIGEEITGAAIRELER